jgi:tetratricopeptide (TPR) repeat protein
MSVINDMLRDLDKRKAPEAGGSQTTPKESLIGPQTSVYPKVIIILLTILLVALLVYFFLAANKFDVPLQPDLVKDLVADNKLSVKQPLIELVASDGEEINTPIRNHKIEPQKIQKQEVQAETITRDIAEHKASKPIVPSVKVTPKISLLSESKVIKIKPTDKVKVQETLKVKELVVSQEPKSMGVKLSPVALDQQMAEKALLLMSQYKDLEAYRELYAFIGQHDEDMESRTVLASYLLNENRMAEVGDVLLNAPLHKSPKLRQIKARWYVQQGKHNLALYTLSADLPAVENYPEYYVLLAAYYQRYGTAKEAKASYSVLVDYDETVADWWAGLGLASDRNNEKAKALYAYQQALELPGLSPELLNFVKPRLNQLQAAQASLK